MTEREFLAALGARLHLMRVACGLSQRPIADVADIHRTVVGRIERGQVNFGIDYLRRLAQALGIGASWPLPDTDHPHPSPSAATEHRTPGEPG